MSVIIIGFSMNKGNGEEAAISLRYRGYQERFDCPFDS
jgi:hypothetical protein